VDGAKDVVSALRRHLDDAAFSDVDSHVFGAFNGSRVSRDARVVKLAEDTAPSSNVARELPVFGVVGAPLRSARRIPATRF